MRKIAWFLLIIIGFSCSQNKSNEPRFSEAQIAQLGLDGKHMLSILNENSLKLDFNEFLSDNRILPLGEFVEHVTYVPLQTTKESLIGEITKLIYVPKIRNRQTRLTEESIMSFKSKISDFFRAKLQNFSRILVNSW